MSLLDDTRHNSEDFTLQPAKVVHHRFNIHRPRTLAALLCKPKFKQASDSAKVAIDLAQVGHGLQVNNRADRLIQSNGAQERRLRHARLRGTLYQLGALVLGHETLMYSFRGRVP
jgi:hypothetical protein